MEITGQDVVRRYLYALMQGRFSTKTELAVGMGTSRPQLQASIRQGYLTVPQMNALAESLGSSIWGVMKELASLAEAMEKGRIQKLTDEQMAELLGGRQRKGKGQQVLQGELDEAEFSADPVEILVDEMDVEIDVPVSQQPQQRLPAAHGPRRQR